MTTIRTLVLAVALALAIAACGGSATTTTIDPADLMPGDIARGAEVYKGTCVACHGVDAQGIDGLGKSLVDSEFIAAHTEETLAAFIKEGRARNDPENTTGVEMPPSGGNNRLSVQDLLDVSAYLISLNS